MSEHVSTRVDDRLLGVTTLDTGTSVRVVRADALDEADLAEAVQLLSVATNGWPSVDAPVPAVDHLRWQLESPYDEHPGYVTLVRRDGRLTSLEWFTFRPFLLHGRGATGAGPGGTAKRAGLDAGERAQMRNLRDLIDAQFDVQLRFQADGQDAHEQLRGRAFEPGNRIVSRTRVLDRHRVALERSAGDMALLPAPVIEASLLWSRAIAAIAGRTAAVAHDVSIEPVTRFDERIDEFFVQAARSFTLIGVRDAPFLNWRYCDERGGPYLPLVATEDDSIAGYAVLRLTADRAYVADLLTLPARPDIVAALLRRVVELAEDAGAMSIEAWLPATHPDTETYKRLGFFDTRHGPVLTVNDRGRGGPGTLDFLRAPDAAIHLALGDSARV